uniref:ChsH2 C-terminal OB-fold domain-containing protein n=2 Tax=Sphingomonas sp. JE1 TaxID=1628059 RepID=A0A0D4ZZ36_9SPHN|nr:hypothetical protein pJE1_115 [Sphingomonas sp. JE1]
MPDQKPSPRPAVPFLKLDDENAPFLAGSRCGECGAVAPGERPICNACGARSNIAAIRLGTRGKLYSYTIVHRSFPGVKTPFIAAIVNLEGGGAIKGTLLDVTPDPEAIAFDLPVDVVFRDTGQVAADGAPFLSYYFTPAGAAAE